jgi:hypothetical protein
MRRIERWIGVIGALLVLIGVALQGPVEGQAALPLEEGERLRISGDGRMRLRQVSSTGMEPVGAYGEILGEGSTFRHRMLLELEVAAAPGLQAAVMVRQSDEGALAFSAGSERLASERGSLALRYRGRRVNATMGYYRLHLTPLTMMRWDLEDNPEGGGQSACACPGAGGAVTGESLEEMGPDLTLEGVRWEADLGAGREWSGFAARPRTATEGVWFRQMSYGTTFKMLSYHRPSMSFRSASLTVLQHRDEENSVDRPLGVPYRPMRSRLVDLQAEIPVGERLLLAAEGALSRADEDLLDRRDVEADGHGLLASVRLRLPASLQLRVAYQRLSADFHSSYRAISYEPNRHGWRLAVDWEGADEGRSLWAFYKRLRNLETESGAARQTRSILSLGGGTALGGVQLRSAWIFRRDPDAEGWSGTAELSKPLATDCAVTLQYRYVDHRDAFAAVLDHHTHLLSLLSSVSF